MSLVKFIVIANREILFGDATDTWHLDIAQKYGVEPSAVCGGGFADRETKTISGTSHRFGPYDKEKVRQLLPDWTILDPSP